MLYSVCEAWQRLQARQAPAGSQWLIGRLAVLGLQMTCKSIIGLGMLGASAVARSGGCSAKAYHSIQAGTQPWQLAVEKFLHMDTGGPARWCHEMYSVIKNSGSQKDSRPNCCCIGFMYILGSCTCKEAITKSGHHRETN